MNYAKLSNGKPFYMPNPVYLEGNFIGNPSPAICLSLGFKPVICVEAPMPQPLGRYEEVWTETEHAIVQDWVWREESDEDELPDSESLSILLGR